MCHPNWAVVMQLETEQHFMLLHSGCRCRGLQFGEIQIVICCVDQNAKMKMVSQTKLPLPPVGFYECMYVLVHMSLRLDYKIWQVQREKKCMYLCVYRMNQIDLMGKSY